MTMIQHAGYETIDLQTFIDFVQNKPVDLPPRPLLLTFDDARADSWTGADGILRKLHFNAVMFVDVGRVDGGDPEYLTWQELATVQDSGRWQLQLHSGKGHTQIHYGPGSDDYGPFYAYEEQGEDFDGWRDRVHSDIAWGQKTLADHASAYRPLAFAPPYGSYGQDGTNDARIPDDLLGWLTHRYEAVFTQDVNARAQAGARQPLGRIQVTRATTGGDLHEMLLRQVLTAPDAVALCCIPTAVDSGPRHRSIRAAAALVADGEACRPPRYFSCTNALMLRWTDAERHGVGHTRRPPQRAGAVVVR